MGAVTAILAIASMVYIPSPTWSRIACGSLALLALASLVFGAVKKRLWIEARDGVVKYDADDTEDDIADGFAASVAALFSRKDM